MKKILFLLVLVVAVPTFAITVDDSVLSKLSSKDLRNVIKCMVNERKDYSQCVAIGQNGKPTVVEPIVLDRSNIIVDKAGMISIRGTGFAPKDNILNFYYYNYDEATPSNSGYKLLKGPFKISSTENGKRIAFSVKSLNLTDEEYKKLFYSYQPVGGGMGHGYISIERADTGASAIIYISILEDENILPDGISVAQNPTLKRSYNSKTKEENLTGSFNVVLVTRKTGAIIPKRNAFHFNLISSDGQYSSSVGSSSFKKPAGVSEVSIVSFPVGSEAREKVSQTGGYYFIKPNSTVTFDVSFEYNPQTLFAGKYSAKLAWVDFVNPSSGAYYYKSPSPTLKYNKTNEVAVIGERAPFIKSAFFDKGFYTQDEVLYIKGDRLKNDMTLVVNGVDLSNIKVTQVGSHFYFNYTQEKILKELNQKTGKSPSILYSIQVRSKDGVSNFYYVDEFSKGADIVSILACPETFPPFISNLTIGSQGKEVIALQCFLRSKGYLSGDKYSVSGYFGELTKNALYEYQKYKGISEETGYFGPITRAAVNVDLGVISNSDGTISVKLISSSISVNAREGSSDDIVTAQFKFNVEAVGGDVELGPDSFIPYVERKGVRLSNEDLNLAYILDSLSSNDFVIKEGKNGIFILTTTFDDKKYGAGIYRVFVNPTVAYKSGGIEKKFIPSDFSGWKTPYQNLSLEDIPTIASISNGSYSDSIFKQGLANVSSAIRSMIGFFSGK